MKKNITNKKNKAFLQFIKQVKKGKYGSEKEPKIYSVRISETVHTHEDTSNYYFGLS